MQEVQKGIVQLYKKDIAKYDPEEKLYLEDIFNLIPAELNSKNKRFILKNLNENFKFSRYEHSFLWLKEAGVALPVYCAQEPEIPLLLSKSTNLFKLFLSDVGLLASMYADGLQIKILNKEKDINFGAVYENAVAQELRAHGFDLYYFNSKKQGELDFLIEYQGAVLPIEVKSGKSYERHRALDNVLKNKCYGIRKAIVFCNDNVRVKDKVMYCPVYLAGFLFGKEEHYGSKKIEIKNVTVFENVNMEFNEGINIFIGENGMGKTHIMKLLYAACKSAKTDVSFPQKVVRVFRPDGSNIRRLVSRKRAGETASVKIYSDDANIGMRFTTKTNKWAAKVTNEAIWEKQLADLSCTFIPAKEILSNAWNLEAAVGSNNVEFDDTYVDIVMAAKIDISAGRDTHDRKRYLEILQEVTSGKVTVEKERFYLKPGTQAKIEFNLVAEGIRKIALLWQLIKNGTLEKGAILFWDEPEANINPKHIPTIVDMLLELQRNGVQIFISTHDYFLAKYFEVKKEDTDKITYYSLYDNDGAVEYEQNTNFRDLKNNDIMDTFLNLYESEIDKVM